MSSFFRKAMWPAALIVGMFVLIGAIGTATAPTAQAAANEVCDILGPFPTGSGLGESTEFDNELLVENNEYLFIVAVEDTGGNFSVEFNVDDETGDADITSFSLEGAPDIMDVEPGVDIVPDVDANLIGGWDVAFLDDLEADWGVTLDAAAFNLAQCNDVGAVPGVEDALAFVTVECDRAGTFEMTAVEGGAVVAAPVTEEYECVNAPSDLTVTASPTTIESYPAIGNVSHSLILAVLTDGDGHHVAEGYDVDFDASACVVEGIDADTYINDARGLFSAFAANQTPNNADDIEDFFSGHTGLTSSDDATSFNFDPPGPTGVTSYAAAVLHCEGEDPGTVTVDVSVEDDQVVDGIALGPDSDLEASVDVTVVGPPAFITMTAAPTELVCGEKATILVTVTDAINQNVSNHTPVELITNFGGVLGGTGSSLGFPGVNPVNPLSSSAAETFGGVATAYLLTSTTHVGPYEVVASAGGSNIGANLGFFDEEDDEFVSGSSQFSTPVVTSQVTVTCSAGAAPDVTAPDTGTGTISPPNTGDAGLASSSAGSTTLLVIAGAVAFVLAGIVKFRFARW